MCLIWVLADVHSPIPFHLPPALAARACCPSPKIVVSWGEQGAPRMEQVIGKKISDLCTQLERVPKKSADYFMDSALVLEKKLGPRGLAAALAMLAGFKDEQPAAISMLTGRRDYVTLQIDVDKGSAKQARTPSGFRELLRRFFPDLERPMLGKVSIPSQIDSAILRIQVLRSL